MESQSVEHTNKEELSSTSDSTNPVQESNNTIHTTKENISHMFGGRPTLSQLWKKSGLEDSSSTSGDSKSGDTSERTQSTNNQTDLMSIAQTVKQEEEEHKLDDIGKDVPGWLIFGGVALSVGLLASLLKKN